MFICLFVFWGFYIFYNCDFKKAQKTEFFEKSSEIASNCFSYASFWFYHLKFLVETLSFEQLQIIVADEHSKYEILLFPGHHLWCVTDRSLITKQDLREGYLPTP